MLLTAIVKFLPFFRTRGTPISNNKAYALQLSARLWEDIQVLEQQRVSYPLLRVADMQMTFSSKLTYYMSKSAT